MCFCPSFCYYLLTYTTHLAAQTSIDSHGMLLDEQGAMECDEIEKEDGTNTCNQTMPKYGFATNDIMDGSNTGILGFDSQALIAFLMEDQAQITYDVIGIN